MCKRLRQHQTKRMAFVRADARKGIQPSQKPCAYFRLSHHRKAAGQHSFSGQGRNGLLRWHYPTWLPGFTGRKSDVTLRPPSKFSAERIIPWLSMPIILRGAKLATKSTSLPTKSSGL